LPPPPAVQDGRAHDLAMHYIRDKRRLEDELHEAQVAARDLAEEKKTLTEQLEVSRAEAAKSARQVCVDRTPVFVFRVSGH